MEVLRFRQFVLGQLELNDLASSPICNSVCKKFHEHGRKQASPFKVSELEVLHQVLSDVSQDRWGRLMAGMIFLTVSCTCSCVVYKFYCFFHIILVQDDIHGISWLFKIFLAFAFCVMF